MTTRREVLTLMGAMGVTTGLTALGAGSAAAQAPTFLTLRGGGSAGSWYIGSSVISTIVNRDVENTIMTATLGAGNRNVTDVDEGSAQYGLAVGRSAVEAFEGIGSYERKHEKVRAMMALFPLTLQIIARKDSGIETFDDLIGKRVSAGQQGFTTLGVLEELLKIKGHTLDDVDHYYINYADANQQLQDGQLDAVMSLTGYPNPPYQELESLFEIAVVGIDEELAAKFSEAFPGYSASTIPASAYPSWNRDTLTLASPTLMIVNEDQPDEEVYQVTKAIFEKRAELAGAASAFRDFTPENVLGGIGIPMHPGAERYWSEAGITR